MSRHFADLAYTARVRAEQRQRLGAALPTPAGDPVARLGEREIRFIAARDSFFLATVGEGGWPHVQHRGGPAGFLRVVDPQTLAFGDYAGNRQFVSVGNLAGQPRAALILVDYAQRRRLKILAEIEVQAPTPATLELVAMADAPRPERILWIRVAAFDWNCSQHITPRYTADEWRAGIDFSQT